jgi:hypothetical protein
MKDVSPEAAKLREIEHSRGFAMQQLRELTTNLLRIARGAGDPQDVSRQISEYVMFADKYREAAGRDFCPDTVRQALAVRNPTPDYEGVRPVVVNAHNAIETAIAGSLQVAASRLQQDSLREAKGIDEMTRAFDQWSSRSGGV